MTTPTEYFLNATQTPGNLSETVPSRDHVIAKELGLVCLPIIILFGTIGNVLSFLVLVRRRMRLTSVYFYLTVLSCSDTLVLFVSAFKTWVAEVSGFEFMRISDASCKITSFLVLLGLYLSSWIIVLLTVDRCVAVCFPLRAAWLCTIRHAKRLSLALFLTICVYNLHVFWTFGLYTREGSDRLYCHPSPDIPFMGHPFEVFKLASYCFLPFALVIIMNSAIIYQIRMTRRGFNTQNSARSGDSGGNTGASHARVTYMLLTVSFTWFFMTAPFSLLIFLATVHTNRVGRTVIFLLMYMNHSVNFLLYCVTGRKFRRELKELFLCKRSRTTKGNGFELKSKATDKSLVSEVEKMPLRVTINACNGENPSRV